MPQPTPGPATKVMTAYVPTELADQVDHFAAKLGRSRAWAIKQALTAWVEQEADRRRLTLEGLEDVKAGRTIDHAAVHAWAQSLGTDKPLPLPR